MIILHTADWHIGQSFYGYDRKAEHLHFFDWLKRTVREQGVDVLLIAGDVFDSPNPSAESQKIYYTFLKEITTENPGLQIVIIAGNHDSAARLEAPNPLLEAMNISVVGTVGRTLDGEMDYERLFIPLQKEGRTEAWCLAVPFLRQGDYPQAESYSAGIREMYNILYEKIREAKDEDQPIVVMGHLHASGSELSENDRSERIVGTLESVGTDVFEKDDIVYTALGHLHKPQAVSGRENIRYAGSPLPMSFSEKNYKHGVDLIRLENGSMVEYKRLSLEPLARLISLPKEPKPLSEVLEEIAELPDGEVTASSPYLELKVLITEPEPSMRTQIETALKEKAVRLTAANPFKLTDEREARVVSYEELKNISPMDMAEDIFRSKYGGEMPEAMKRLLLSVIQEAEQ